MCRKLFHRDEKLFMLRKNFIMHDKNFYHQHKFFYHQQKYFYHQQKNFIIIIIMLQHVDDHVDKLFVCMMDDDGCQKTTIIMGGGGYLNNPSRYGKFFARKSPLGGGLKNEKGTGNIFHVGKKARFSFENEHIFYPSRKVRKKNLGIFGPFWTCFKKFSTCFKLFWTAWKVFQTS